MRLSHVMKISVLSGLLLISSQAFSESNGSDKATSDVATTRTVAQTPEDDMVITNTLKKLIHDSKVLSKHQVDVSTTKGDVTISGEVDSDTQASLLVEYAESIVGVSDVDTSKLTVKDGQSPIGDALITAKIKGLLIREKLFGEKDIAALSTGVETKDGVVYLSGAVDNQS
ncbi:MAG: BON domain-containing protein, partial [Gammaproteobacteria bacterium]